MHRAFKRAAASRLKPRTAPQPGLLGVVDARAARCKAAEVSAEPQEARAEIAKLEGEVAYPEAHIAAAELLPPLHRELATMQGRENRLLAQQSIGASLAQLAALQARAADLAHEVEVLKMQRLTASFTTHGYQDLGKDARLGLTPGLLHKGLALLSDVELLQRLIGDVLTALGIPSSDETPSPELSRDSTPPTIGMGREVTGDEEVTSGEKVAADTPGSSAQRLPGWSILDLARRLTNAALPEDQRVQRVAFKLLTALASSLRFPGAFKDTRSSAGLLVSPAAKPYSVLVTPSWTLPTWSAAVAVFEFKPHASQDELDVMMGQLVQGCMAALRHQPHRSFVYAVGLTMDTIEVFRFRRPEPLCTHPSSTSTGPLPFSLHPSSTGFQALAGLLSLHLNELGVVAAELPQRFQLDYYDQVSPALEVFHLQLLQIGSRRPCGNSVYVLLTKPMLVDNAAAGPGSTAPEAVLKLGDLDVLFEAETLFKLHQPRPLANVVQLVAFGTCTQGGRAMNAMIVAPFAHRLEQAHSAHMFAAVACDVAQAIGELSERGILHRDITPNNFGYVFRGGQCRGLLYDFSVATTVDNKSARSTRMKSLDSSAFPAQITGTLAWAPYSVLLGQPHTLSSQLEGLFISLHSVATGALGRPGCEPAEPTVEAWVSERLAQFAGPTPPFSDSVPEPLRPLITALHGLFWTLPVGCLVRKYNPAVTVSNFISAVRSTTAAAAMAGTAAPAGS